MGPYRATKILVQV